MDRNERSNALGVLQRSTSQREQQRQQSPARSNPPAKPSLARNESQRARDLAAARLEGSITPDLAKAVESPGLSSGFFTGNAPPRLSALQRRHLEKEAALAKVHPGPDDADGDEYHSSDAQSPSFSIFTPSMVGPSAPTVSGAAASSTELKREPSVERQQARSNLIRKLSKRDVASPSEMLSPATARPALMNSKNDSDWEIISDAAVDSSPSTPRLPGQGHHDVGSSPTSTVFSSATDAPSEFRSYRHTMERDRDSAFAKFMMEDQFEYAQLLNKQRAHFNQEGNDEVEETLINDSPANLSAPTSQGPSAEMSRVVSRSSAKSQDMRRTNSSSSTSSSRDRGPDSTFVSRVPSSASLGRRPSEHVLDKLHPLSFSTAFPPPEADYKFPENGSPALPHSPDAIPMPRQLAGYYTPPTRSSSMRRDASTSSSNTSEKLSMSLGSRPRRQESQPVSRQSSSQSSRPSVLDKPLARADLRNSVKSSSGVDSDLEDSGGSDEDQWGEPLQHRRNPTDSKTREAIMARFNSIVSTASKSNATSNFDETPRKLLLHSPVLQVVNANTVKDRYLFLFNDMLLIAKTIIEEDPHSSMLIPPSLTSKFLVKSIIELDKLKLTSHRDDDAPLDDALQRKKQNLLNHFVDRFANDPKKAISSLVSRGGLANDPTTIANLLFRTSELNRSQLGTFLCKKENKHVLKAYVDRFRLGGVRLEDALRLFLLTIRLPNDPTAAEYMLVIFASVYVHANPSLIMEQTMCGKLVMAMMELNDYLHSGLTDETGPTGQLFGFPNPAITVDDFSAAFRSKDPKFQVGDAFLARVYASIKKDRIQQAADNAIASVSPEIPVTISPAKLPSRLTFNQPSMEITVSIPKPDPRFYIQLLGSDAKFEPNILHFGKSRSQSFRITGTVLGHRTVSFLRCGTTAIYYTGLPVNKTFTVERAFMQYTYQLSFVNHLGVKRKYMFSMNDSATKSKWLEALKGGIETAQNAKASSLSRTHQIANAVALQVLRDSLIAPDDPAPPPASSATSPRPGGRLGSSGTSRPGHNRSNSFSKTYAFGLGKEEMELASPPGQRRPSDRRPSQATSSRRGSKDDSAAAEAGGLPYQKSGNEVVTAACQNSHLPAVLGLLNAHVDQATHPLDGSQSNFINHFSQATTL